MECFELHQLVDAWLDGECDEAQAAATEAHVLTCAACRSVVEQRRTFADDVRRALAPERQAAQQLCDRVLEQLANSERLRPTLAGTPATATHSWPHLLWAAAVALLLAIWILGPQSAAPPSIADASSVTTRVQLTAATGPVEIFDASSKRWREMPRSINIALPLESIVRTAADVRCELRTEDGGIVRLNDKTEVALLEKDVVELRHGQMWCQAPQATALEVRVLPPAAEVDNDPEVFEIAAVRCAISPSSCFTCAQVEDDIHFVNAAGAVNVQTVDDERQLAPGETAQFSDGQFQDSQPLTDPILTTRWMHPLLTQRPGGDDELQLRVQAMLQQIGHGELSALYEKEIRALGAHAAEPLVNAIRSPQSPLTPERRLIAMQLASELATASLIPDLIELLDDNDSDIRRHAEHTLRRLTGENPGSESRAWRDWWHDNQRRIRQ